DQRRRRWSRRQGRDELGDLVLGAARRLRKQLCVIFMRQMRSEQTESGEMDAARAHPIDQRRQLARRACDEDAVVCRALGKAELPRAEREHRGERALEVELALGDLAEVTQQVTF